MYVEKQFLHYHSETPSRGPSCPHHTTLHHACDSASCVSCDVPVLVACDHLSWGHSGFSPGRCSSTSGIMLHTAAKMLFVCLVLLYTVPEVTSAQAFVAHCGRSPWHRSSLGSASCCRKVDGAWWRSHDSQGASRGAELTVLLTASPLPGTTVIPSKGRAVTHRKQMPAPCSEGPVSPHCGPPVPVPTLS